MANHFPTIQWAKNAVLYEVNIRQYSREGTFEAFSKHLLRLKKMGVDIIWLMPINPISVVGRQGSLGSYYACSSYSKINEEFGTITDFKNLVANAHSIGLKVIIDWVANHTGIDHHWTLENPNWYIKDEEGNFTEKNGWKDVIDLNYEIAPMRTAMIDAMQYWINECDIDGFRCDMAHLVPVDFWQEARTTCDAIKPLFWLAECEVMEYHNVFDVTYAWNWMHETEKFIKADSGLHDINNILHSYSQYPKDCYKLFFTANHDENSWNGSEYEKYGNMAKAFAVFTFTWQGMPLIYSGQESPNKKRLAFFDKDLIEWNHPLQLENFYTTLSKLHKSDAITNGETFILPTGVNNVFGFFRRSNKEIVLVLLNLSKQDRVRFCVERDWLMGNFKNVFSGLQFSFGKKEVFELMSGDYLVYQSV
ncbi:MAG: alpha-amylase family glycosyl hydrolase [Chitinophagaceae bacterium]